VAGDGAGDQSYVNTIEDIVDTLRRPPSRGQSDLGRAGDARPQQLRHQPHTDATHRFLSQLFYFPPDNFMEHLDASLHVPTDCKFVCDGTMS